MADRTLTCRDCGGAFVFTQGEQEFFAMKGFTEPTRCPDCRQSRKRQRANSDSGYSSGGGGGYGGGGSSYGGGGGGGGYGGGGSSYGGGGGGGGFSDRGYNSSDRGERQLYDTVCEQCGAPTKVPFKPRGHRPVYCRTCFDNRN